MHSILVVDDEPDIRETLRGILEDEGYNVLLAESGEACLEQLKKRSCDVVLLDIGMPRLNGYEAACRIRGQSWGREMILVALTGWGQEEDKRRAADAGFNAHLVKPVDPAALERLLGAVAPRRG